MDELIVPQHWGNGRIYGRYEDVTTEDDYETVVVQLRDSEGFRYGRVRMTREAALELAEYLIEAARLKETVMEARRGKRKSAWPIDASPALKAREMGCEMTMMAVLHESVDGSRQDAPVYDMTRQQIYVKVMGSLRMHRAELVAEYRRINGDARLKEHVNDVITSMPDEIVLHLADLWDDGQTEACAALYMECSEILRQLQEDAIEAEDAVKKAA